MSHWIHRSIHRPIHRSIHHWSRLAEVAYHRLTAVARHCLTGAATRHYPMIRCFVLCTRL
jgi:hypothetical protein